MARVFTAREEKFLRLILQKRYRLDRDTLEAAMNGARRDKWDRLTHSPNLTRAVEPTPIDSNLFGLN